ncbi:hypothetical protein Ddye_029584 [Dipteronia dyeriana]|uniref:Protein TSSC4 n=1 Tax=Dipteronia dyeriana TaxID=168575 RepID=A0AAD9TEU6_9ROSI|nr:hypothetical protein Ddye_029584 [Dipteronia dyeriana]
MDDSFRVRVEKIFGSLSPAPAPAPAPSAASPWSLSDDAVEKREWRREDKDDTSSSRDETPCSSSFDGFFSKKKDRRQRSARRDLGGDDDYEDDGSRDMDSEEWEIRSSIGLDNTLDNEEEEDEFDIVASGKENAGERLYMNDVTNRGSYLNLHNVIPNLLNGADKDLRANLLAARIRLKEDEVEAGILNVPRPETFTEVKESQAKASEGIVRPKPILKRKDNSSDSKPQKRVRFDPDCDQVSETFKHPIGTSSVNATDSDDGSKLTNKTSRVPDYILNPSKYTRYSFDSSSEFDEGSDTKACMGLLELIKRSKGKELGRGPDNASGDLPKSVTFIPKKKAGDGKAANSSSENNESKEDDGKQSLPRAAGFHVGIAAVESQDYGVAAYEEIEPETNAAGESARSQKPLRNYRTQSRLDDSDS